MLSKETKVSRAEANDPRETLKARVEAKFAAALEQKATLELTQTGIGNPANQWEVFAWGPYQDPGREPGRIIMVGEKAYIAVAVWMNDTMCNDFYGWRGKIALDFFTSNMQTMGTVVTLNHSCCIFAVQGKCFYVTIWEFTPTEEACLLETNICARLCNCDNKIVPQYAGFVRHVFDFDPETLFPPVPPNPPSPTPVGVPVPTTPGWQFDRPIRYMVVNPDHDCGCDPQKPCP